MAGSGCTCANMENDELMIFSASFTFLLEIKQTTLFLSFAFGGEENKECAAKWLFRLNEGIADGGAHASVAR